MFKNSLNIDFFKIFRIRIVIILVIIVSQNSYSQENPAAIHLTLEQARKLAIEANTDMLSSQLDVLLAEDEVKRVKNNSIPEVSADFNLQHNIIIPQTPVPARAFNPDAKDGELLLLQFATKWTGNAGINLNYDLYDPAQKSKVKQSILRKRIAENDKESIQKEVILNCSKAYIEALIAQEQRKFSYADSVNKATVFNMLSDQYKAGRITLLDLNKGKATYNTAVSKSKEARNISEKSDARLLYILGYNPVSATRIHYDDSIERLFNSSKFSVAKEVNSLNLEKLEIQKSLLQEQKTEAKMNYFPKLSIGAFFGNNYFDNQLDIFQDINWHGNSYVKMGIKIPLSDWFKYRNDKAIVGHQLESNELAYKNMQNLSALNFMIAQKDMEFFKSKYNDSKANFELQEENFSLVQQQFDEGRILIKNLSDANYDVEFAKNVYLNAAYDYLLAQLQLEQMQGD